MVMVMVMVCMVMVMVCMVMVMVMVCMVMVMVLQRLLDTNITNRPYQSGRRLDARYMLAL